MSFDTRVWDPCLTPSLLHSVAPSECLRSCAPRRIVIARRYLLIVGREPTGRACSVLSTSSVKPMHPAAPNIQMARRARRSGICGCHRLMMIEAIKVTTSVHECKAVLLIGVVGRQGGCQVAWRNQPKRWHRKALVRIDALHIHIGLPIPKVANERARCRVQALAPLWLARQEEIASSRVNR